MEVTFSEMSILKIPMTMRYSFVCLNDFGLLMSLRESSLIIIAVVKRVVAAVERTAEIRAATKIPVAHSGK